MKKKIIILLLVLPVLGFGQQITLEQCLDAVKSNHPLAGQAALYNQSSSIQQRNNNNALYPVLNVYGQSTYQNEVAELPISLPGIDMPEIPKLQYRVALEANQLIYDGGVLKAQNTLEDATLQLNMINNEAEIYKMRERVNAIFFSIMLYDRNLEVVENTLSDLTVRLKKVEALVLEGVSLPANAEALKAEILKARQRQTEIQAQKPSRST
jgi:outer membrane protein TolC